MQLPRQLPRRRLLRLAVLSGIGAVLATGAWLLRPPPSSVAGKTNADLRRLARDLAALEAVENQVAQTAWAKDLQAQEYGLTIDWLWDSLNAATNKLGFLAKWLPCEVEVPVFGEAQTKLGSIALRTPGERALVWRAEQVRDFLYRQVEAGWELSQSEFRHNACDPDTEGRPQRSVFHLRAHLLNAARQERAVLEGDLGVLWQGERDAQGLHGIKRGDASGLALATRRGAPPFREVLKVDVQPPEKSHFIDPLILYDLDGDGFSEVILAARNLVYRRRGDQYVAEPLCQASPGLIFTAVIADFDQDGVADFLCAKFEGLWLHRGTGGGAFAEPGRQVWTAPTRLKYGQVLTAGDIDGDGDLDLWLGQYKGPYERGQMPTPYYDANDGNASYLLLNDGAGHFTDATDTAGLAKKRWRRSYSGSLVDLDGDGDLDLIVVSDFAGTDLYANDGRGHFTDVTALWIAEPHAFGMAHALADFNRDGQLDFLVLGMHCPTALRLDHLGLTRPGWQAQDQMRGRVAAGNRLYLAQPAGGFAQTALSSPIARSGWSWGCSAEDFNNDGFPDVYIVNGHETRQSVRDYEPEFWLHDIYVGTSHDDLVKAAYFGAKFSRTRGHGYSYGGYEKNRLYLNQQAQTFLEAGHLLGVALEEDCRNVVGEDLDGDGRVDLVLTTFEAWPQVRQTLRIFRNEWSSLGHWIGFRFREQQGCPSPVGARVVLRAQDHVAVRQLVTGDSHRSQHALTVHFGLGNLTEVESVEVRWPSGQSTHLPHPTVNQWHWITVPRR